MSKITLSQHERIRLYRLLAGHQADALTLHHVKNLMSDLADFPEDWDQICQATRLCRVNPDSCCHRDAEIVFSKRALKVVEDVLTSKSKANQLSTDQLSLVEKLAPNLLPDDDTQDDCITDRNGVAVAAQG